MGYDLDALAKWIEEIFVIEKGNIRSPGKYRRRIKPGSVFCYCAGGELGVTATALAGKSGLIQSVNKHVGFTE